MARGDNGRTFLERRPAIVSSRIEGYGLVRNRGFGRRARHMARGKGPRAVFAGASAACWRAAATTALLIVGPGPRSGRASGGGITLGPGVLTSAEIAQRLSTD